MAKPPTTPQVVVVTGASAGLGRAIVRQFAERGARIGLLARSRERLEQTRREVEQLGGQACVCPLDVADAAAVERAAGRIEQEFGPIDVWINNAMLSVYSPVKEMEAEEYRRVTEVTYLGYVYGTLAALKRMLPRDRGVIIQVGSALAYRAIPLQSAYCASKHAINGFTESLRSELIHDDSKVRVTQVQMPALNTPQFEWVKSRLPNRAQPVPPIFQPEVGAEAVLYAVDHDVGRELQVGWPSVKAILGDKVAPGLLDHYLADKAYEGQQTDEPKPAVRPDNLWRPVQGDFAAHGRFDDRAKTFSWELWLRMNRSLLAAAGVGLAALGAAAVAARRRDGGGQDGAAALADQPPAEAHQASRGDGALTNDAILDAGRLLEGAAVPYAAAAPHNVTRDGLPASGGDREEFR